MPLPLWSNFVFCIVLLAASPTCFSQCWQLPSGEVTYGYTGSTPPVKGAKPSACPNIYGNPSPRQVLPSLDQQRAQQEQLQRQQAEQLRAWQQQQEQQLRAWQQQAEQQRVYQEQQAAQQRAYEQKLRQQTTTPQFGSAPPQTSTSRPPLYIAPNSPQPVSKGDPCSKYYGRGYCTDYIQERLGFKQPGDALMWRGNTSVHDVRSGDVVIISVGTAGHVAYVEQVVRDSAGRPINLMITEKNWGKVLPGQENQVCVITVNFGTKTSRLIPLSVVARVWRPQ